MELSANSLPGHTDVVPPARGIRRTATGLGMIGFTALLIPQGIVDPTDASSFRDAADQHPVALFVSGVLLLASALLTFPAISGVLHQARDRGALVADIGAVFAALGALGHAALGMMYLIMRSLAGGDTTEMSTFEERFNADVPVGVVGLTLLLSFGIGIALLVWAAWRAGMIGVWGPVIITAVVVAHAVLPDDLPSAVSATAIGFDRRGLRVAWRPDPQPLERRMGDADRPTERDRCRPFRGPRALLSLFVAWRRASWNRTQRVSSMTCRGGEVR